MGEIFKGLVENGEKKSDRKSESLSENDDTVLYYISGYIIWALEKKYNKIKKQVNREKNRKNKKSAQWSIYKKLHRQIHQEPYSQSS